MLKIEKSLPKLSGFRGRTIFRSLLSSLLILICTPAQDIDYWASAPTGSIKIYTISFNDEQNGTAESSVGETLTTTDGGFSWFVKSKITSVNENPSSQIAWKAEIYCSIMKTTDGGITWFPYEEDKQEHFCGVYLKDSNTGYKVASEFLNKVTSEITDHNKNNNLNALENQPHKCTEYYRSADEGWALGWCVKNFNQNKNR